jgi:uncharacterized protein (DUF4415 family)
MPLTKKNPRDSDSPFLTREAVGKGISFQKRFPGVDPKKIKVQRVADDAEKNTARSATKRTIETISVPVSHDVAVELRATGPEWPKLADKILRDGLKKLKQKAA